MPQAITADRQPIINDWQARGLIALLDRFYSDPKNKAAYEKWKAEREIQNEHE